MEDSASGAAGGLKAGATFEAEDETERAPAVASKKGVRGGLGNMKDMASQKAKLAAGAATSVAAAAKNTAAAGIHEAGKIKELKKFIDLDLEVFNSTEEADRKEMEEDLRNRRKWGGILHPETTISIVYNQIHVVCLLYMGYRLPVRTAFMFDPAPGSTEFLIDVSIDLFICLDIFLNFHKVSAASD